MSARQATLLDVLLAVLCAATGLWRDLAFDPAWVRLLDLPPWCYASVQLLGAVTLLARPGHPVRVA